MKPKILLRGLVLVTSVLISCGEGAKTIEVSSEARDAGKREWDRNEAAIAEAARGTINTDEFLKSVRFFHELTGISVRGNGTPFGLLPTDETKEDLVRLQEWCKKHCDEIYWDEATRKVKRLPEKRLSD